jgi:hypothetical protein
MLFSKIRLLFILLLLSIYAQAGVETIRYNIFLFGDQIGVMTLTHEQRADGTELYTLESNSKAKLLWIDKENLSRYDVIYKNGRLISSTFREVENKKLKRWTNMTWTGTEYAVDGYKGKKTLTALPDYCAVSMYFHDVSHMKRILYNAEGEYDPVEYPEADICEFKSSDGARSVYHLDRGRIKSIDIHISIATVRMVRVD